MTYDVLGPGPLDYLPCRYGASRLLFRGPKRDLSQPYLAFVGATETYGKFIETPFPALVEKAMGRTCVNFGQVNAGVDVFCLDPYMVQTISRAEISVIQIVGAQNMSNRFYSVHPRRNDRFVGPSTLLQTIFREVDFADFHFNKHMLSHLAEVSQERFQAVRQELQEAWKARMKLLLKQIKGKSILLWVSDHAPQDADVYLSETKGSDPLLITRDMLDDVASYATHLVEVVASPKAIAAGTDGMLLTEMDMPAATEMLGPMVHEEAAEALVECIRTFK
ncbi:MAG: DUF6473 family protein [Sulfitobacter sp.]